MCEFKPGDEVVCVDANQHDWLPGDLPMIGLTEGQTYTIRRVGPSAAHGGIITVWLNGARNSESSEARDWGYAPFRFRKVQKRNDRLTIEAFFTVPGGFEEPKRTPAKRRERA